MAFRGKRVMLSRNLVAAQTFDVLHGVLKDNGAEVCLCSNPEFNSSSDFHVVQSMESKKFAELRAKGCNVVGPECILRCAKERRGFPSSPYTCCLTFEGIRILPTGFEGSEKNRVHQLVLAMCGQVCSKASMDVDFVIAKDVLAPKYKWAAFELRKPILSVNWLSHCFREHRRVPHEPYRLPVFTGVRLCTTGILMDQRKKIEELVKENGGILSADLTRECTHLIAKSTDSDKFKVATNHWTTVKCVNEDWFWDSLSEKVCLGEKNYTVQGPRTYVGVGSTTSGELPTQYKFNCDAILSAPFPPETEPAADPSTAPDAPAEGQAPEEPAHGQEATDGTSSDVFVQPMYLSACRFYLTGFDFGEMRRLVDMVLNGGGTRHMEFNPKVTHIVLGKPSDTELKDVRKNAVWGAVYILLPTWLEECERQKREVPVTPQFCVPQSLLLNDSHWNQGKNKTVPVHNKPAGANIRDRVLQSKLVNVPEAVPGAGAVSQISLDKDVAHPPVKTMAPKPASQPRLHSQNSKQASAPAPRKKMLNFVNPVGGAGSLSQETIVDKAICKADSVNTWCEPVPTTISQPLNSEAKKGVFEGRVFGFAPTFKASMREEVVQRVLEGGGRMSGENGSEELQEAEYMISPHGQDKGSPLKSKIKRVTSQWITYCLQEGTLLDINSHVLFQPLPCEVPLPGFQSFKIAISQYGDMERDLLGILCLTLGAAYQETKMNRRATHLLCKVGDGAKYEFALQWGAEILTGEWLYACVAQNRVVPPDSFRPKKLTAADREGGLAIPTQCPVQLTPHDNGASVTERCSVENPAEVPLPPKVNELATIGMKGKTATVKKKSSLQAKIQALQNNRPVRPVALTSQKTDGNLDPWDELTASFEPESSARRSTTRSQQKGVSLKTPANLGQSERPCKVSDPLTGGDKPDEGSHGIEASKQIHISEQKKTADPIIFESEETDPSRDVAAAIEGLLAQTSKVQNEDASRSPDENRDLLSHDRDLLSIQLSRRKSEERHGHPVFKRPKLVPKSSADSGGDQPVQIVTPSGDSYERYEESQMDSQVVAYDEDYSEKQRIMERLRTRSTSTTEFCGSGDVSFKAVEFMRLLKAADANK